MTREQVWQAVGVGIEKVRRLKEQGYGIVATGEMGIGNTTTSSAAAAVLLGLPAEQMTGRGAGLSAEGLERKVAVIKAAIKKHRPDPKNPLDVLAKVGGLDIAGLAGVFLGGALYRIPVVVDGFISSVAALCAARMVPLAKEYMICSHVSKEPAGKCLLDALGLPTHGQGIAPQTLMAPMRLDKKSLGGALRIILLKEIGACYVETTSVDWFAPVGDYL